MAAALALFVGPAVAVADDAGVSAAVDVRIRYVDVVVTDRSGDPIVDLTRDEIEVREDGEVRDIVDFYVRSDGGVEADGEATPVDVTALDGEGARPDVRSEEAFVVLLFDVKHMSFGELDRPKKAALKMLDQILAPGTKAAVVVLRHHLEVKTDFTDDRSEIEPEVEKVLWWVPDAKLDSKLDEVELPAREGVADDDGALRVSLYPRYAEAGPDHSLFGALEALGGSMKRLGGAKSIVLFSEGGSASFDDPRVEDAYQRMVASLNGAGVTVIAVDAEGLRGRLQRSDKLFRALPQINLSGRHGKSHLVAVSRETGGDALIGSSNMAGFLRDTLAVRRQSYVIGYTPRDGPPGEYRELEVRVSRRGARVVARKGVEEPGALGPLPLPMRMAQLRQVIDSWVLESDVPVRIRNYSFPVSNREGLVVIDVELPAAAVRGGVTPVTDVAGSLVEARSRNIHDWLLSIPAPPAGGAASVHVQKVLRLPFGQYVSKAAVRRGSDGGMGSTEVRLEVPRLVRIGPLLGDLVLLDAAAGDPLAGDGFGLDGADALLVSGGRRLVPSFDRVFRRGDPIVLTYGLWGLARGRKSGATSAVVVVALRHAGRVVSESRGAHGHDDGLGAERLHVLTHAFDTSKLEAGEYEIEVRIADRLVDKEVRAGVTFVLQ